MPNCLAPAQNQGKLGHLGHSATDCATSHTNLPHLANAVSCLTPVFSINHFTHSAALSHAQITLSPNHSKGLGVTAGASPKALSCNLPTVLPIFSPPFAIAPIVLGINDATDCATQPRASIGLFLAGIFTLFLY